MIKLTQELLDTYVGGQLIVRNVYKFTVHVGEVSGITLDESDSAKRATFSFDWWTQLVRGRYVTFSLPYGIDLGITRYCIAGNRIELVSDQSGECMSLIPAPSISDLVDVAGFVRCILSDHLTPSAGSAVVEPLT